MPTIPHPCLILHVFCERNRLDEERKLNRVAIRISIFAGDIMVEFRRLADRDVSGRSARLIRRR